MFDWIKSLFAPSTPTQSPTLPSGSLSVQSSPILGGVGLGSGSLSTAQSTPQTAIKPAAAATPSPALLSGQLSVQPYNSILYGVSGLSGSAGGTANSTANSLTSTPTIRPLVGPLMTSGNFYSSGSNAPIGPTMSDGSFYSGSGGTSTPSTQSTSSTQLSGDVFAPAPFVQVQKTASASPIPTGSLSISGGGSNFSNSLKSSISSSAPGSMSGSSFGSMFSNSLLGPMYLPSNSNLSDEEKAILERKRQLLQAQANTIIPQTPNTKLPSTIVPETLTPRTAAPKSTTSVSKEGALASLNDQALSAVNNAKRQNPLPDQPMINDQAQEDALNSIPQERRSSLQQEIDTLKADMGYSDAVKQKQELGLKLQAVNDIFGKAIKEIESNSELPKGLAARRIGELNKEWNLTANQYAGSIGILNQTLEAIDAAVNERLKIKEMSQVNTPDLPGSVQEYQYAVNQGFAGSYTDFKKLNSSGVTINMGEQIQGAVDKQNALDAAKRQAEVESSYQGVEAVAKTVNKTASTLNQTDIDNMSDTDKEVLTNSLATVLGVDPKATLASVSNSLGWLPGIAQYDSSKIYDLVKNATAARNTKGTATSNEDILQNYGIK